MGLLAAIACLVALIFAVGGFVSDDKQLAASRPSVNKFRHHEPVALRFSTNSVIEAPKGWVAKQDGPGWWISGREKGVGLYVRLEARRIAEASEAKMRQLVGESAHQVLEFLQTQRLVEPVHTYRSGHAERIVEAVLDFTEEDGRITRAFRWYNTAAEGDVIHLARFFLTMPRERVNDPDMRELVEMIEPQPFRLFVTSGPKLSAAAPHRASTNETDAVWRSDFAALTREVFGDSITLNIPRLWACAPPDGDSQRIRCFDRKGGPGSFWICWSGIEASTPEATIDQIRQNAMETGDKTLGGVIRNADGSMVLSVEQESDGEDPPLKTLGWYAVYPTPLGPMLIIFSLMMDEASAKEADFRELIEIMHREVHAAKFVPTQDAFMRAGIRWS